MAKYVALLRGINVGGNNLIKMPDLKTAFETAGFEEVTTYIQSGNVIFTAPPSKANELAAQIEDMLLATFGLPIKVVLRSQAQMRSIVRKAPAGFGSAPDLYRYDVVFLKPPLNARTAMRSVSVKPEVDEAHPGTGVLYFSRLNSRATQSRLNRTASMPAYQNMTLRNWNTTTKLLELMGG